MDKNYYKSVANRLRIEMDGRSPKSRLVVVEILTQAGVTPASVGTDEFLAMVTAVVDYVSAGLEEYVEEVTNLPVEEVEQTEVGENPTDTTSGSYL